MAEEIQWLEVHVPCAVMMAHLYGNDPPVKVALHRLALTSDFRCVALDHADTEKWKGFYSLGGTPLACVAAAETFNKPIAELVDKYTQQLDANAEFTAAAKRIVDASGEQLGCSTNSMQYKQQRVAEILRQELADNSRLTLRIVLLNRWQQALNSLASGHPEEVGRKLRACVNKAFLADIDQQLRSGPIE